MLTATSELLKFKTHLQAVKERGPMSQMMLAQKDVQRLRKLEESIGIAHVSRGIVTGCGEGPS